MIIIFYQKSTGKVFSYVSYDKRDSENNLIPPSVKRCATQNGVNESDVGVKEWALDPVLDAPGDHSAQFKNNINDLNSEDLTDLVT
jgi:hypothetical protein